MIPEEGLDTPPESEIIQVVKGPTGADEMYIASMLNRLDELDDVTLRQLLKYSEALARESEVERCRLNFLEFVKRMWPQFIGGYHHKVIAKLFEDIASGKKKRLIINLPPRHTKSELGSFLLPAWYIGQYPGKKIIQATHTGELSVNFGRKVRDLVDSEEYRSVFPTVRLKKDTKAAGRWNTSAGGEYWAVGVGAALAGKGADLFIIDDPTNEQDGMSLDQKSFEKVYEWYTSGPRQRLQPNGAILLIMTRWNKGDLTGRILKKAREEGDTDWEVVELPAILPSGKALWPEYWSLESLLETKRDLPPHKWRAQYQQDPLSEDSAIIKREWWKRWPDATPPKVSFIIQSWDTAFTANNRSNYSAVSTWGIFMREDEKGKPRTNIILLDSKRDRMEFPALKKMAINEYKAWKPDIMVVEAKSAGLPLIQELRQAGIPVSDFSPSGGQDKVMRVNAVADLFSSGIVWVPERAFAEEMIDEFSEFPNGMNDDLVDTATQALLRFRMGGFIQLHTDEESPESGDQFDASFY